MRTILILVAAGALGTLGRYGLGGLAQRVSGASFPYGTLIVNVLGCFIIGLVMQIALNTNLLSPTARTAVTIGFLGAFTTFSTFSYETVRLLEDGAWISAAVNTGSNVGLGLLATFSGMLLGKAILGGIS